MKGLKKLALASAIIAASSSAFAMQAMDDEALSAATGQDGLTINLDTNISNIDLFWKDAGGFGTSATSDGTVAITGLGVVGSGTVINIDAGTNTAGSVLNIGVSIPSLTVNVGKIYVGDGALYTAGTVATTATAVLSIDNSIVLNNLNTTVQLGNGSAHLVEMTGTLGDIILTGGLTITDLAAGYGGSIDLGTTTIRGVSVNGTTIDVTAGGLIISSGAQTNVSVEIDSLALGTATSIGSVKLANIATGANTITVRGH